MTFQNNHHKHFALNLPVFALLLLLLMLPLTGFGLMSFSSDETNQGEKVLGAEDSEVSDFGSYEGSYNQVHMQQYNYDPESFYNQVYSSEVAPESTQSTQSLEDTQTEAIVETTETQTDESFSTNETSASSEFEILE